MVRNGFTLVEMLVVIALMALLTVAVVLTVRDSGPGVRDVATRFASRVAASRDEAILSGKPVSVWVTPSGYGFERFKDGAWAAIAQQPFEGADWGRGVTVSTGRDGKARDRVRFDTLGMPDRPFALVLARDGASANVEIAANGDVAVK